MAREDYWGTTSCKHCGTDISYRYDWNKIPEYCRSCNELCTKNCANPDCYGEVSYKVFWDRIPEYCNNCRGWRTKTCKNPDCQRDLRFHDKWDNVPEYCNECKGFRYVNCPNCGGEIKYHDTAHSIPKYCSKCKGWSEKDCANSRCGNQVKYHHDWVSQPDYCKRCLEMSKRSNYQFVANSALATYWRQSTGSSRKEADSRLGPDYWHITVYSDHFRVSADFHKFSNEVLNEHGIEYGYKENGQRASYKANKPFSLFGNDD